MTTKLPYQNNDAGEFEKNHQTKDLLYMQFLSQQFLKLIFKKSTTTITRILILEHLATEPVIDQSEYNTDIIDEVPRNHFFAVCLHVYIFLNEGCRWHRACWETTPVPSNIGADGLGATP
jgi:hypothetical protein